MPKTNEPARSFRNEAEERAYWETADSAAEIDWSKAERVRLPNLEPSKTSISLRLPVSLLERIKIAAHKRVIMRWRQHQIDAIENGAFPLVAIQTDLQLHPRFTPARQPIQITA